MNKRLLFLTAGIAVLIASAPPLLSAQSSTPLDTAQIEQITGLKGTPNKEENVFKVSRPRSDVKIAVDAWAIPPFMGLTSWAAFTLTGDGKTMMMGIRCCSRTR